MFCLVISLCILRSLEIASPFKSFLCFKGDKSCDRSTHCLKLISYHLIDLPLNLSNLFMFCLCNQLAASLKHLNDLAVVKYEANKCNFQFLTANIRLTKNPLFLLNYFSYLFRKNSFKLHYFFLTRKFLDFRKFKEGIPLLRANESFNCEICGCNCIYIPSFIIPRCFLLLKV